MFYCCHKTGWTLLAALALAIQSVVPAGLLAQCCCHTGPCLSCDCCAESQAGKNCCSAPETASSTHCCLPAAKSGQSFTDLVVTAGNGCCCDISRSGPSRDLPQPRGDDRQVLSDQVPDSLPPLGNFPPFIAQALSPVHLTAAPPPARILFCVWRN